MNDDKYPIGKFSMPEKYTEADLVNWLDDLRLLPERIEREIKKLDDGDFETPYRDGGWTIKQVINHLADSHINMYVRVRMALTQTNPTIVPYDQDSWAYLIDAEDGPVEPSIMILDGIHQRLLDLFDSLRHGEFERSYFNPENNRSYKIWEAIALYAWHSNHHLAHIKQAKKRL